MRTPVISTFKLRRVGAAISVSSSATIACGPCSPVTRRTDPEPSAAIAFIAAGSKLLPRATAWNVPGFSAPSFANRLANATGSASPLVEIPSPR